MLERTIEHLIHSVLPAVAEYEAAERDLSVAYAENSDPTHWVTAARQARHKAHQLAVAIDALTDRAHIELGVTKAKVREDIRATCVWPANGSPRVGGHDRVRGVANAYKHADLTDTSLPISSDADILVVGLGYGLDGWGVGKFGGVEVIVRETGGTSWKYIGDAVVSVGAWFRYIHGKGGLLPYGPFRVMNVGVG